MNLLIGGTGGGFRRALFKGIPMPIFAGREWRAQILQHVRPSDSPYKERSAGPLPTHAQIQDLVAQIELPSAEAVPAPSAPTASPKK